MADLSPLGLSVIAGALLLALIAICWLQKKQNAKLLLLQQQQLDDAKKKNDELQQQLQLTTSAKVIAETKVLQIENLQQQLTKSSDINLNLQQQITEHRATIAALQTTISQEKSQFEEKIALLQQAKQSLTQEFQLLSNKIFEEKGKTLNQQHQQNLNQILQPLKDQMYEFRRKVEDVYDKESKDRVSLLREVVSLKELNQKISEEAVNLTNALKGQVKTQGTWGEMILEKVLEASGLKPGREYEVQTSLQAEDGSRYQPDVVVHLPEEKDIIIDSKVSLVAFERYCNAETVEEKEQALKQHLLSLKGHINNLSEKDYSKLPAVNSLDFVLLFVPIEAAFLVAIECDQQLYNYAFQKNIMLVSPSTLAVTLRTIHNLWRYEDQNQNALLIAKKGGDLYDKFAGFIAEMENIGTHINRLQGAYDTAQKRLVSGKGNLLNKSQELLNLGIKAKKKLDKAILTKAQIIADDTNDDTNNDDVDIKAIEKK